MDKCEIEMLIMINDHLKMSLIIIIEYLTI